MYRNFPSAFLTQMMLKLHSFLMCFDSSTWLKLIASILNRLACALPLMQVKLFGIQKHTHQHLKVASLSTNARWYVCVPQLCYTYLSYCHILPYLPFYLNLKMPNLENIHLLLCSSVLFFK